MHSKIRLSFIHLVLVQCVHLKNIAVTDYLHPPSYPDCSSGLDDQTVILNFEDKRKPVLELSERSIALNSYMLAYPEFIPVHVTVKM